MRTGNLKYEKLMLLRLEISLCKVCRVDSIFSYTFYYQIFCKKCEKRVYVPCTPCTSPMGEYQQMREKMLSTLQTLHEGRGQAEPASTRGDAATPHKK